MNIQERFSLRKSAVGLVSVSLLCAIYTSTVAADTVVTGVNEIIEESQVKDEVSIESEKNESLDGSNIEIVEEIADNIPSPVIAEGEVAVEMKVDRGTENVVSRNDTEVTTSEQNQIEVTETKEILNQTSYQTESGEQRQIIWAHGITPPAMEQSGGFVKEKYGDYLNYTAPFEAGKGYYDTNKSLNASFIDLNLCFAAVSSNMVHWWLEQNSSYVERYLKEKKGTVNVEENYAITDLRRYINSFQNQQNSRVFDMFKTYYGYRTNGFVSDALVDLFINGYKPKAQGGVNLEDSQLVPDSRGGFFYDVFKEKKLTNRIFSGSYERFGEDVRTVLESKGLLGLTYRTLGYATHIVTVWGAEYDNQGKIKAVYITDSDDQQEQIGLKRMGITRDASGNPRLNNHMKNNSAGALLDYVHTIRLGQDLWEEYFNPLAKAKETASQTLADTKKALDLSIQGQSELPESMRLIYLEKLNNLYNQGILSIQKAESSEMLSGALENGLNSLKSLDFPISEVGNALAPDLPVGDRSTVSDVDSLSSQETSSTNLEADTENAGIIADGTNQLHFPVEAQTTSSVEAEGDNVFEQEADTLPIIIENKDEFGSELSRNMQTSETDSLVVAVEEDVKNDEVSQVEELLESEKVENQSSELLSDTLIVESANDKEEDRVEAVVSEQPDSIPHQNVEISLVEPTNVETETVVTPINDAATPHGSPTYIDNSVTESVATPLEKDSIQAGETEIAEPTSSESTNVETETVVTPVNDVATPHGSPTYIDNSVTESVATPLEKDSIQAGETEIAEPTSSESTNVETETVVTPVNDVATPHGSPTYIDNSVTESVATPLEKDSIQAGETEIAEPTSSESTSVEAELVDNSEIHAATSSVTPCGSSAYADGSTTESVATPLEKDSIQTGNTEIAEPTSSKSTNVEAASVDNSEIHADASLTAVSSVNLDNPVIEPVAISLIGSKRDTNAEVEVSSLSKREVRKTNTDGLISVQSKVIKKELLESSLAEAGSPLLEATIAQSSNSNSTEIGMSYQNTVLLESNNTERQVSKAEIVMEHKETELVETVSSASEPVVLVENISQTSNNTIESGKNMGVQSQAGAKQILGVEQSSKVSTPTSRQIMGVGLLTLVLGSALGLLKKRRK
ncbi:host-specific IgM cysteine endopeptidase Ide-Ssuis [Streptococcus suis]|uniref:host-specific IgM cysteine endopeptidase Ide-Ssuis n=1 Tax=Streptococcus suis TaxID=1307 RepID=UPI0005CCC6B4|nr:IdeS family IgM protease [Streptococcus suis]MBS0798071.1 IdeS family IgM protease [Streptococcus suis]MBS0803988.1 IdeS family IgM protease [Streptococcus suis]MBS7871531.1 YSIRK-type signal peptide-containing protein [Streptococcus suis]MBS7891479.1 YSIRK-type signal peptide-containing protein [Streptococcus suis]MBS7905423.1 YSIRK-type signal peptide-containing protein [Streptococcus suis]